MPPEEHKKIILKVNIDDTRFFEKNPEVIMAIGRLIVNVFGQNQGEPVANAGIQILDSQNKNIIDQLFTNSSGQSDTISLNAPDVEYSLEPNAPKPYSEFDILVSYNSQKITVNNIQIFADTTAVQNVFLSFLPSNISYNIPPHSLYENYPPKIAEDSVKKLPFPSGLAVLPQPVIPEYVIVHDGVPSDNSAPNYWIPYKNYIKNVCSSEIYPTWPYECIVANVLVINSFTLNRIFTEWYRNQNYNFTITSSTAYDQSFVYQRNIFSKISEVVDSIFSQYITKPEIEQPLFTQYCDGENVNCPGWLSQWGSKQLAENGANYVDILKTYYGYNIYFEMAKQVEGIPSSYPGSVLQVGSRGNSVRTIQNQLIDINKKYPLIPKVAADGIYGNETANAVKIFQSTFGLPQTGIVDYATWYEISRIYVAVKKLS